MKWPQIEVEALCRAGAPELARRPLYLVPVTDVYPNAGNGDGPDGCTMRRLDRMLRPTLPPQPKPRGTRRRGRFRWRDGARRGVRGSS